MQTFTIPGELTDLNTYIRKERSNKFAGAAIKKEETERIMWDIKTHRLKKTTTPIDIKIIWISKNQKKDPDNLSFAIKFILDSMIKCEIIPNDGQKNIRSITHEFQIDKNNPRIIVNFR